MAYESKINKLLIQTFSNHFKKTRGQKTQAQKSRFRQNLIAQQTKINPTKDKGEKHSK